MDLINVLKYNQVSEHPLLASHVENTITWAFPLKPFSLSCVLVGFNFIAV